MLYLSLEGIQTPCNRYLSPLLSSLSSSPPSPQCADSAKVGSVVDRVLAKIRERAGGQGGIKGLARYGRTCGLIGRRKKCLHGWRGQEREVEEARVGWKEGWKEEMDEWRERLG